MEDKPEGEDAPPRPLIFLLSVFTLVHADFSVVPEWIVLAEETELIPLYTLQNLLVLGFLFPQDTPRLPK